MFSLTGVWSFGCIWLCLAVSGCVWLCLALSGCILGSLLINGRCHRALSQPAEWPQLGSSVDALQCSALLCSALAMVCAGGRPSRRSNRGSSHATRPPTSPPTRPTTVNTPTKHAHQTRPTKNTQGSGPWSEKAKKRKGLPQTPPDHHHGRAPLLQLASAPARKKKRARGEAKIFCGQKTPEKAHLLRFLFCSSACHVMSVAIENIFLVHDSTTPRLHDSTQVNRSTRTGRLRDGRGGWKKQLQICKRPTPRLGRCRTGARGRESFLCVGLSALRVGIAVSLLSSSSFVKYAIILGTLSLSLSLSLSLTLTHSHSLLHPLSIFFPDYLLRTIQCHHCQHCEMRLCIVSRTAHLNQHPLDPNPSPNTRPAHPWPSYPLPQYRTPQSSHSRQSSPS